jgi:hypothetical protein
LLSVIASFTQLFGYGVGFLRSLFENSFKWRGMHRGY